MALRIAAAAYGAKGNPSPQETAARHRARYPIWQSSCRCSLVKGLPFVSERMIFGTRSI